MKLLLLYVAVAALFDVVSLTITAHASPTSFHQILSHHSESYGRCLSHLWGSRQRVGWDLSQVRLRHSNASLPAAPLSAKDIQARATQGPCKILHSQLREVYHKPTLLGRKRGEVKVESTPKINSVSFFGTCVYAPSFSWNVTNASMQVLGNTGFQLVVTDQDPRDTCPVDSLYTWQQITCGFETGVTSVLVQSGSNACGVVGTDPIDMRLNGNYLNSTVDPFPDVPLHLAYGWDGRMGVFYDDDNNYVGIVYWAGGGGNHPPTRAGPLPIGMLACGAYDDSLPNVNVPLAESIITKGQLCQKSAKC